jgi:hypothetical protein
MGVSASAVPVGNSKAPNNRLLVKIGNERLSDKKYFTFILTSYLTSVFKKSLGLWGHKLKFPRIAPTLTY